MKQTAMIIALLIVLIISIGARAPKTSWQYASLTLLSSGDVLWKSPDQTLEASGFVSLSQNIGYKGKFSFPPEYPLFDHFGSQGWELIQITGDKESMSGAFVCWFKRPK